jgi:hypothetical protein
MSTLIASSANRASLVLEGDYGRLLPQHEQLLRDSAIHPAIARERGYISAIDEKALTDIGLRGQAADWIDDWDDMISIPQSLRWGGRSATPVSLCPSLAFPIWGIDGEIAYWMARPDIPRRDKSLKLVKYERPMASPNVLDVHPRSREHVLDPSEKLYITEGTRKVDAAVSVGLCCIGVLGVWSWRHRNPEEKSVPLDDFDSIPLEGRQVVIVYDSDVATKEGPRGACRELRDFLASRGAQVTVSLLPAGPDGSKVGLDDFLAASGSVEELAELVLPEKKIRKRRNRYSRGSHSDILEQIRLTNRLLRKQVPDKLVVRMLMDGFGVSERTARSRIKGARGEIDATHQPRVASAARLANLLEGVTDRRPSYVGEEKEKFHGRRGKSLASSKGDAVSPERLEVARDTKGGEGRQLSSFSFPLMQLDPASVTLESTCEECGETFTPQRSDGRHCSSACRQRAYRMRKRP